ncbi:hypothetical protein ABDK10_02345 [Staphylococcus aureus]
MNEETIKVRYDITYEKTMIVPAHSNEEDSEIEERIGNHMFNNMDDYTDAEVKEHSEPTIIDRGF